MYRKRCAHATYTSANIDTCNGYLGYALRALQEQYARPSGSVDTLACRHVMAYYRFDYRFIQVKIVISDKLSVLEAGLQTFSTRSFSELQ